MSRDAENTNFIDTSSESGREMMRQENADALSGTLEDAAAGLEATQAPAPAPRVVEADETDAAADQTRMSPGDRARDMIAKRFRRPDQVPYNGDPNDPEMLYGEVTRTHETADDIDSAVGSPPRREAVQQQEPDAGATPEAPKKRRLIVRGKEMFLTDDEILARAAMVTAADSYLEEARTILSEAKQVRAERVGPRSQHPETQNDMQDELDPDSFETGTQRPENRMKDVVEKIQYGDPEEAAAELDRVIEEKAGRMAEKRQLDRLLENDLARSQRALRDFVAANPDLDADKNASRLIEASLYDIYEEDIAKLGLVEPDQMPNDPKTKAAWHRFYRVHGHPVRTVAEALEEAKTRVLKWRGVAQQQTQQASRKAPDRVDVNVNRTERRAAIPNSPQRAVAPRPEASAAPRPSSRSDVIMRMRQARGQVTV